jgi:predicted nucleic acid-binding protein
MTFVLDASVSLAWCFEDERDARSLAVLDRLDRETAIVPSVWPLEMANILVMSERRGRIAAGEIGRFVALLDALDIKVDAQTSDRAFSPILDLARRENLSSYDAAYLDLALREGVALATRDAALAAAADRQGVAVIAA